MKESKPIADFRESVSEATDVKRNGEETLVADSRADITPSQCVEQRLIGMLRTTPLMISQVQRRLKPGPR
jgi:hypothetical protein